MESKKRCYVCRKYKLIEEFYKVNTKIYNICLHDRNRLYCKEHNKKKSRCKICGEVKNYVNTIKRNMTV